MNPHPSAYAALIELVPHEPGARVAGYVDGTRSRSDITPTDVTWCLRQSSVLVAEVDGTEQIRAEVHDDGSVSYPVASTDGERTFERRAVKTLLAGEEFQILHISESRFRDAPELSGTPGLDGGESA